MQIQRVDYQLFAQIQRLYPELPKTTPAHPAFKEAMEKAALIPGLPEAGSRHSILFAGQILVSPKDRKVLGLPPAATSLVSHGEPTGVTLLVFEEFSGNHWVDTRYDSSVAPGTMVLTFQYRRAAPLAPNVFTYRWRCFEHEDCRQHPELGVACLACSPSKPGVRGVWSRR